MQLRTKEEIQEHVRAETIASEEDSIVRFCLMRFNVSEEATRLAFQEGMKFQQTLTRIDEAKDKANSETPQKPLNSELSDWFDTPTAENTHSSTLVAEVLGNTSIGKPEHWLKRWWNKLWHWNNRFRIG